MAAVTVTLDVPVGQASSSAPAQSGTAVTIVALPFELAPSYDISKPDDVEISLVYNGDGYALLAVMQPITAQQTKIRIDNAFDLIDERAQGRVKFECDLSFQNLKKHRGVLTLPMTVSKFDIAITLPNDYEQDQLSFVPPTDKWVEQKLGREYILPAAQGAASKTPVFIAFPSPFKSGQQFAQVVIGSAIALVLLIVQGRVALERKLGMRTIIIAFVLSLLAIIATFYFFLTVAEPLEFMAWAAGPLIPVITASFTCIWLLIAIRAEAEVSGRITSGGESARYVTVSVVTLREGVEVILKQMTVKLDGNYRFFIWCGRSDRSVFIVASGTGTTRAKSETFAVAAGAKIHVPAIDVQRIPIALPTGQTAPTHADATATRGASSITGTPTY